MRISAIKSAIESLEQMPASTKDSWGLSLKSVTVRIKKPKMKRRISIARLMPRFYPMTSQSWKSVFRNFINVKRRLRILFWMKSLWRRK